MALAKGIGKVVWLLNSGRTLKARKLRRKLCPFPVTNGGLRTITREARLPSRHTRRRKPLREIAKARRARSAQLLDRGLMPSAKAFA
jgi:hypothetical protein